ncbi:MAG: CpsD/CapB family tyrosine-protein kinase [Armatimonadetes bacterium]|nr:CpsD/CapB family tyrosine-protein kinase [Armatimonadota bacterium]
MNEITLPPHDKPRTGQWARDTTTGNWQRRTLRPDDLPDRDGLEADAALDRTMQLPVVSVRMERTPAAFASLYAALERQITLAEAKTLIGARRLTRDAPYVLGVTSAVPGEGKTTTALHLALTAARNTFKRVCLIDLSLGRGDLSQRLGLASTGRGLIGVLEDTDTVVPTLQLAECDNLVVIPAGVEPGNPAKLARSPRVAQLLASARTTFDVVIVDMPAASSDNLLPLAGHADGLLVVARAGVTPRDVVAHTVEMLGRDRIIGVALNGFQSSCPDWLQQRFGRV